MPSSTISIMVARLEWIFALSVPPSHAFDTCYCCSTPLLFYPLSPVNLVSMPHYRTFKPTREVARKAESLSGLSPTADGC